MTLDQRLTQAARLIAAEVEVPAVDAASLYGRSRRNRRYRIAAGAAATAAAAIVVTTTVLTAQDPQTAPQPAEPVQPPPGIVVGEVPVWYDDAGLHRGDIVEQAPVELMRGESTSGVLALVRSGALYRDPATSDVWFHPWGGQPRVVGQGSAAGPGGDPEGDVAAWFEHTDLVVYDTARDRELWRATVRDPAAPPDFREHVRRNGFVHVSNSEVVWRPGDTATGASMYRFNMTTGTTSPVRTRPPEEAASLEDVHGGTRAWRVYDLEPFLLIESDDREDLVPQGAEPFPRLSPDGSFVLTPTTASHGAAVIDVASDETWLLPLTAGYPWIAWSYGDVAMVILDVNGSDGALFACEVDSRTCEELPNQGTVLMPTS